VPVGAPNHFSASSAAAAHRGVNVAGAMGNAQNDQSRRLDRVYDAVGHDLCVAHARSPLRPCLPQHWGIRQSADDVQDGAEHYTRGALVRARFQIVLDPFEIGAC
jgi:hypothetical protein